MYIYISIQIEVEAYSHTIFNISMYKNQHQYNFLKTITHKYQYIIIPSPINQSPLFLINTPEFIKYLPHSLIPISIITNP